MKTHFTKEQLNPEQNAIVYHDPDGVLLVQALAGSGKTRCLRHRVPYVLGKRQQQGLEPRCLLMAFNNSVAEELDGYFSKSMSKFNRERLMVRTFHGMATYMLYRFKNYSSIKADSFTIPKLYQVHQALEDHLIELGHSEDGPIVRFLLSVEADAFNLGCKMKELLMGEQKTLTYFGLSIERALYLITIMRKFRYESGMLTHNDTLPLANELPDRCFAALSFTDVMADELQDLNHQQRKLVRRFMKTARGFTGVGDPNQSIFGFAGCDSKIFSKLAEDFPSAKVLPLTTNYRSTDQVLNFANRILKEEIRTDMALTGTNTQGPKPLVLDKGVSSLKTFLTETTNAGLKGSQIALLYRTRSQAPELEMALAQSGVPYILKDNSFFEEAIITDLICYLKLMYAPKMEEAEYRRIFNHYVGLGYVTSSYTWKVANGRPFAWLLTKPSAPPPVNRVGPKAIEEWKNFIGDMLYLKSLENKPKEIVAYLQNKLKPYWQSLYVERGSKSLDQRLEMVNAFKAWVNQFSDNATGWDVVKTILEIESGNFKHQHNPNALTVSTVHKAKGLEWDAVALWNVSNGTFPLMYGKKIDNEEERRILYVAATRAKKHLSLICPSPDHRLNSCLAKLTEPTGVLATAVGSNPFTREHNATGQ